MYIYL